MLKNTFKIAYRSFIKHKSYSLINITGLAIGISCCLLIVLLVQDELSYDGFHNDGDRIYRVVSEEGSDGILTKMANTYGVLRPALLAEFPELERVVRLFPTSLTVETSPETRFQEDGFMFVDSTFFDLFSFTLFEGDPNTVLDVPFSVVLTQATAEKYFGAASPVGQVLTVENEQSFTVTGVVENTPHNSHFTFDFLASMSTLRTTMSYALSHWYHPPMYTYFRAPEQFNTNAMEARFPNMLLTHVGEYTKDKVNLSVQPLTRIHLYSDLENEIAPTGNVTYVYIFLVIATFILLIACINFTNLATARSTRRAREVGMRKTVGATRGQLIRQFYGETILYSGIAMLLAIVLVELFLPTYNTIIGKDLSVNYTGNLVVLLGLPLLTLVVGLLSGSYPALFLSRFRPIQVLRQKFAPGSAGVAGFRAILVTLQFIITIGLIFSTLVIDQQMKFMQEQSPGFVEDQIIILPIRDESMQNNYAAVKTSLLGHANVRSVSAISNFPWRGGYYDFPLRPEGKAKEDGVNMATLLTDHDFVSTFGMEILEGRAFSEAFSTDASGAFILNQAAAERFGKDSPVGEKFMLDQVSSGNSVAGTVVGVVKNFHMRSLRHTVDPLVLMIAPRAYYLDNFAVRVSAKNLGETLASFRKTWREFAPHRPLEYLFLDAEFAQLYNREQKLSEIFQWFAGLAILIGCLGLFGLSAHAVEQRTKEIGIRKVLGAGAKHVLILITGDFMKLMALAALLAWPLAWYGMNAWLKDFAYRIDIEWWFFGVSALLALVVALLTVSTQAMRAVVTNPVETLRHE